MQDVCYDKSSICRPRYLWLVAVICQMREANQWLELHICGFPVLLFVQPRDCSLGITFQFFLNGQCSDGVESSFVK